MRRFENNILALVIVLLTMLVIGLFVPSLRELLWGLVGVIWTVIKAFFMDDIVQKVLILIIIMLIGGGVYLSNREKRKLWLFLTGAAELIAMVVMFVPRG